MSKVRLNDTRNGYRPTGGKCEKGRTLTRDREVVSKREVFQNGDDDIIQTWLLGRCSLDIAGRTFGKQKDGTVEE